MWTKESARNDEEPGRSFTCVSHTYSYIRAFFLFFVYLFFLFGRRVETRGATNCCSRRDSLDGDKSVTLGLIWLPVILVVCITYYQREREREKVTIIIIAQFYNKGDNYWLCPGNQTTVSPWSFVWVLSRNMVLSCKMYMHAYHFVLHVVVSNIPDGVVGIRTAAASRSLSERSPSQAQDRPCMLRLLSTMMKISDWLGGDCRGCRHPNNGYYSRTYCYCVPALTAVSQPQTQQQTMHTDKAQHANNITLYNNRRTQCEGGTSGGGGAPSHVTKSPHTRHLPPDKGDTIYFCVCRKRKNPVVVCVLTYYL